MKRLVIASLLLTCLGIFIAQKLVQQYGFSDIGEFISVYSHNKDLADKVEPEEMQLLLSDEDYAFLESRRNKALERGIQINDGEDNYVECKIVQGTDTIKGEMRLKGHMTDHLEGDKWSFRVKTKKKPVFGMSRFSLQAPGTRNYAYEWVYHQLLKHEGIIHLNYDFIRLKLNEKDLGIYAVEEHFGQHVLEHNDRPSGAILRWNPNLYWEWRINELQGTYIDEQYSSYASSFVEPYEKGSVEDDSILVATYLKGTGMLEEFRRGEKTTSEIFDVEKMARFHAIIDLVGGHHSLDWSDVKFFYNSESGKIEPVGYESFSVRKTESICGQRIPDSYENIKFNYHDRLFSDPIFFEAYIEAVERICDEKYLHNFIEIIQPELDKKLGVLAHEFPYRKFTFDPYFENILLIRKNLELPKPFHAFKETSNDTTITISLTPVSDYPIEILALTVDGKEELKPDVEFVIPAKARNTYAHYFEITFRHTVKKIKNLKLKARIPGSSNVFEIEVSDLPGYNLKISKYELLLNEPNSSELVNLNDSTVFFNSKEVVINAVIDLTDTNQTLILFPGQHIHFKENGKLFIKGNIEIIGGSEEGESILISADDLGIKNSNSNPDSIPINDEKIVIDGAEMICSNVEFIGTNNLILANQSVLYFRNCLFAEIDSVFMNAAESNINLLNCNMGSVNSFGRIDRCLLRIKNFNATNGEKFISAFGSDIDIMNSKICGYNQIASLNYNSSLSAWNSEFSAIEVLAELNFASSWKTIGGFIKDAKIGFKLDRLNNLPGDSFFELYKTESSGIETMSERK